MTDIRESDYHPTQHEPYMSARQLAYFRTKLLAWRESLLLVSHQTLTKMTLGSAAHPDPTDRASDESDAFLELRTRDRYRKLIAKIDNALKRIENGTYGYCKDTGEPIGIRRLEARPVAELCVEAQARHEKEESLRRN
jgi:DnaK suppressor protein